MRRSLGLALALMLMTAACGDDDSSATTMPPATAATTTTTATTTAPTTTDAPTTTPAPTTTAGMAAPPSVMLDDPAFAMEPPDTSYRAQLAFSMRAELDDGSVQEGTVMADGGKLLDPERHAMVVGVAGFTTLPNCFDIAGSTPNYVSAYHTFFGGLSGDEGGDLTGEAFLSEAGITSNGVVVDRYSITLDNIQANAESEYTSFSEAYMDIAHDGGYLVSLVMVGMGRNNTFSVDQTEPRLVEYRLDFSEFGEITEFTSPAGCG